MGLIKPADTLAMPKLPASPFEARPAEEAGRAPRGDDIDRRLPSHDEIFLDHVGHFVPDRDVARGALMRAGFAPTPVSVGFNPDGSPTGTGNLTAMLEHGYIEVLFKSAETALAHELDSAIARHAGVHLAAFAVADAGDAHRRLERAGFALRPLVEFTRPVETESGSATAAFTVVRVQQGVMPEGRIQILTHGTESVVWQPRWIAHPNGALGLAAVTFVVADPEEAAQRFARFTDRSARRSRSGYAIALDRGRVEIVAVDAFAAAFPEIAIPAVPFTGAYGVVVKSLNALDELLRNNGVRARMAGDCVIALFPEELGKGAWLFAEESQVTPLK
ncbi:MAG TPA: VOC family protein [Xanthobacteraceae bacterium]|jgi:hypothetical protein